MKEIMSKTIFILIIICISLYVTNIIIKQIREAKNINSTRYYITDKKCDNLYMDFADNTEKVYRICIR